MTQFIERNRGFFRGLSGWLWIVSTVLLVLGGLWAALKGVAFASRLGDWQALREEWAETPSGIALFLLLGLVGRGLSQLLRYMHDPEYRPGWLLRHADKLLYAYAAILVAQVSLDTARGLAANPSATGHPWWVGLAAAVSGLYALAAALVLAGLGQILKRLMPVLDEARTLA